MGNIDFLALIITIKEYKKRIEEIRNIINEKGIYPERGEVEELTINYERFISPYLERLKLNEPGEKEHFDQVLKYNNPIELFLKWHTFFHTNLAIQFLNEVIGKIMFISQNPDFLTNEIKSNTEDNTFNNMKQPSVEKVNYEPEEYVFKEDGDFWTIVFNGEKLPSLRHMHGFCYIQYLLKNPNKEVAALDLYYFLHGRPSDVRSIIAKSMAKKYEDDDESELENISGDSFVGEIDEKAKEQYRRKLKQLAQERAEAEENSDQAEIERINREVELIENELKDAEYDKKKNTTDGEKARKNVSRRIKKCIEKISSLNDDLTIYLNTTLKIGNKCVYNPAPNNPIIWHF